MLHLKQFLFDDRIMCLHYAHVCQCGAHVAFGNFFSEAQAQCGVPSMNAARDRMMPWFRMVRE
jgi:hypothetical protein